MTDTYKNVPPIWTTDTVTDYTYSDNMSVTVPYNHYNGTLTITGNTASQPLWTFNETSLTSPSSGKIKLTGENPDIEIGEHSLMEILEGIRRQLALVKLRPDLEEEFEELRRIGDEYRAKEKELLEKRKVWETLKK